MTSLMKHHSELRILHLSDFHFDDYRWRLKDLFNKRLLGFLNYHLKRKFIFNHEYRLSFLNKVNELQWDWLIVTGDLTNLATEVEFADAFSSLQPILIQSRNTIMIPGNHDRYTRSSVQKALFEEYFGQFFPVQHYSPKGSYFIQPIAEDVVIVGFDMTSDQPLYSSRGFLDASIIEECQKELEQYQDYTKIAIGHYPVWRPKEVRHGYLHRLKEKEALRTFLLKNQFSLYLHGHIHKSWSFQPVPHHRLTCVNSGGCVRYRSGKWSGAHLITIDQDHIQIEVVTPA